MLNLNHTTLIARIKLLHSVSFVSFSQDSKDNRKARVWFFTGHRIASHTITTKPWTYSGTGSKARQWLTDVHLGKIKLEPVQRFGVWRHPYDMCASWTPHWRSPPAKFELNQVSQRRIVVHCKSQARTCYLHPLDLRRTLEVAQMPAWCRTCCQSISVEVQKRARDPNMTGGVLQERSWFSETTLQVLWAGLADEYLSWKKGKESHKCRGDMDL